MIHLQRLKFVRALSIKPRQMLSGSFDLTCVQRRNATNSKCLIDLVDFGQKETCFGAVSSLIYLLYNLKPVDSVMHFPSRVRVIKRKSKKTAS